jgi:hypothetical protein
MPNGKKVLDSIISAVAMNTHYPPEIIMKMKCHAASPHGIFWWAEQLYQQNQETYK